MKNDKIIGKSGRKALLKENNNAQVKEKLKRKKMRRKNPKEAREGKTG